MVGMRSKNSPSDTFTVASGAGLKTGTSGGGATTGAGAGAGAGEMGTMAGKTMDRVEGTAEGPGRREVALGGTIGLTPGRGMPSRRLTGRTELGMTVFIARGGMAVVAGGEGAVGKRVAGAAGDGTSEAVAWAGLPSSAVGFLNQLENEKAIRETLRVAGGKRAGEKARDN